jgi:hypothetical protein
MIAVDFDGTIAEHRFPEIGDLKKGVVEGLKALQEMGFYILIYSCRTCKWFPEAFNPDNEVLDMNRKCIRDMVEFLDKHGVPYNEIDDGTKGKPLCDLYIDDKGLRFDDQVINWCVIPMLVEQMFGLKRV